MKKKIRDLVMLNVRDELVCGFDLLVPYPEWKRLMDAENELEMTQKDREDVFRRYDVEHGPVRFYVEGQFDVVDDEAAGCDPCLRVRPVGEAPDGNWREVTLEEAAKCADEYCEEYRIGPIEAVTDELLKEVTHDIRGNPSWKDVYAKGSARLRKYLVLTYLLGFDGDFSEANSAEINDRLDEAAEGMSVADWELMIAAVKQRGRFTKPMVKVYERYLEVAKEREALKDVSVSALLKDLKRAYRDWEANKLNDGQYNEVANRCQGLVERLDAIGRVSVSMREKFDEEYTANMYAVTVEDIIE